jgi:uncharacterized protein YfaT (DUF1175 family)
MLIEHMFDRNGSELEVMSVYTAITCASVRGKRTWLRSVDEADARPGDVVTYDDANRGEATHIAFWLGDGRILYSTEREDVDGVVEEPEPAHLRADRRRFVRFETAQSTQTELTTESKKRL